MLVYLSVESGSLECQAVFLCDYMGASPGNTLHAMLVMAPCAKFLGTVGYSGCVEYAYTSSHGVENRFIPYSVVC